MQQLSKRGAIRLASFAAAAAAVLISFTAVAYRERDRAQAQLQITYLRSLQDAADLMTEIGVTLEKGLSAGTPEQMTTLSAKLWRDAGEAKSALAALPVDGLDLSDTYKFLTQVGDYAMVMQKKMRTQTLTSQERGNLENLRDCAGAFCASVENVRRRVEDGRTDWNHAAQNDGGGFSGISAGVQGDSGFSDTDQSFTGYPTLIYDGPFSDHMLERVPALTAGAPEISRDTARELAAQAMLVPAVLLDDGADEESRMPCYTFTQGDLISAAVTKKGGFIVYMADGRPVESPQIDHDQAREQALEYLGLLGMANLRETYYETAENRLLINYAHTQRDIICYPDLVKVGVALDTGEIVFFDARGYIMNHRARELPVPQLTADEARASVSALLDVKRSRPALIPAPGGGETLCHEFYALQENGQEMLVYINAQTGAEEQILKMVRTAGGVLTQ